MDTQTQRVASADRAGNPDEAVASLRPFIASHSDAWFDLWQMPKEAVLGPDFPSFFAAVSEMGMVGGIFEVVASWWPLRHNDNVLLLHFADMKRDLEASVRRIAGFLGFERGEDQWAEILEYTSFGWMKTHEDKFELRKVSDIAPLDPGAMIRRGQTGKSAEDGITPEISAVIAETAHRLLPNQGAFDWCCNGGAVPAWALAPLARPGSWAASADSGQAEPNVAVHQGQRGCLDGERGVSGEHRYDVSLDGCQRLVTGDFRQRQWAEDDGRAVDPVRGATGVAARGQRDRSIGVEHELYVPEPGQVRCRLPIDDRRAPPDRCDQRAVGVDDLAILELQGDVRGPKREAIAVEADRRMLTEQREEPVVLRHLVVVARHLGHGDRVDEEPTAFDGVVAAAGVASRRDAQRGRPETEADAGARHQGDRLAVLDHRCGDERPTSQVRAHARGTVAAGREAGGQRDQEQENGTITHTAETSRGGARFPSKACFDPIGARDGRGGERRLRSAEPRRRARRRRDVRLVLLVVLIATVSLGCGRGPDGTSGPTGRVSGQVLAGPTCPVERPEDPSCRPVPVSGFVELVEDDRVVASAALDESGRFAVDLAPGHYLVRIDVGDRPFPICGRVEVDVEADAEVMADVACDTGIR